MSNSICRDENLKVKHVVTLFEEVQHRYVNKLLSIDEKHITNDERNKQKIAIYESYIKDLTLQTRLLLQSLDELEKEANQRVTSLESKLKKAHASLQHHRSLSDLPKTNFETDRWKLTHENLDLKHDLDCLASFISLAKRTGKWNTKQLQLKTIPLDRIIGVTNEKIRTVIPSQKEIQYRDEHIQVLQSEIEHLRRMQTDSLIQTSNSPSAIGADELQEKNLVLSKKVDDLRSKLTEECQKTETFKMDIRLKTTQLKDLQDELNQKKQQYEEHIHDLSTKLKTISDRHRESTTIINNDSKLKNQQIEQLTQQVEQSIDERGELHRQCCSKDTLIVDLEAKIHSLERQLTMHSQSIIPREVTVTKVEYEQLNQELHSTRRQLCEINTEMKTTDALNNKLEQDLRLFKKFHDEQFEQQIKTTSANVDQLQTEIRTLKLSCQEKTDEFHKQSLELRTYQERLSAEQNKNQINEHEQDKLRSLLKTSNENLDKSSIDLKQTTRQNDQLKQTIHELDSRNNLLERKLIETMKLIDLRNQTLIDNEQQIAKIQNELTEKQKEFRDKQSQSDQLEQNLIAKTTEISQLTEKLQTDLVKHQKQEENATHSSNEIKVLQRELRHLSESLVEHEHINTTLNERVKQLINELRVKQEEFQQIEKSLNKQMIIKQDQLVRYDQNLHEAEIKCKYAQEECLIQEKEIIRLNLVQEEQEKKINILQQDLLKLQEQNDAITIEYERSQGDLQTIKYHREDENRQYSQEFEKFNHEITALKIIEVTLLKTIDELKDNLFLVSNERNDIQEQYNNYHNDLENIQKILFDETESSSKSASKLILLTRQLDEEQKRVNESKYQFNDLQLQLTSALLTNDTFKAELSQARLLTQEYLVKEIEFKQNINRINSLLDERNKSFDDRQRELETMSHLMGHLQGDYDKSKSDLTYAHDQIVHLQIENETLKQHLGEKTNELTIMFNRLQQCEQDCHTYEKEHRYSNEEYFEYEQQRKSIENELTTVMHHHEKLQREHQLINEQFDKCRYELDQIEQSDLAHKERLIQSMDEGKIYKQKLALLGDCFKTVIRKASETSDQWANITTHLDEQIIDLSNDVDKLHLFDERFEQSIKLSMQLRSQHDDLLVQYSSLKSNVEKVHRYLHQYKHRWAQITDENRYLRIETKHLRDKIENCHRVETIMHTKNDEQEISLGQLRKDLNYELQARLEAQRTIEQLKHALDETVAERNHLMKNNTNAHKKIERLEHDNTDYTNENHLLKQAVEKQFYRHNESVEQTERSYQDKISECESLLISLTETHQSSLHLLEEKKMELDTARSEIQELKSEQSSTVSKLEKFEEINQEFKRHISILERSIEEHKRLVRKREKELEQIKNQCEQTSSLTTKCTKQDTEISVLRMENGSLNEELRLMRENITHCPEEQRRSRSNCDQTFDFIPDGISHLCLNNETNNNGNEILRTCLVQNGINNREHFQINDPFWFPFVRDLPGDLNDCLSSQKKYKLMKAYSKQQQFLLNQLEAHVQFYESMFDKRSLPAIECPITSEVPKTLDVNSQCKDEF